MANQWQTTNTPKPYSAVSNPGPVLQQPHQSQQEAPPPYTGPPVYHDTQPIVEYAIIVPRPGAGRRFLSSFFVATFIWLLLSLLVQSSVNALQFGHKHHGRSVGGSAVSSDLNLGNCVSGKSWNQARRTSPFALLRLNFGGDAQASGSTNFTLPISSDALLFLSRGQNLGGSITIITSPTQSFQSATINVQATSNSQQGLQQTKACLLTRNANENGVGVFTPTSGYSPLWNVNFHITVILPDVGNGEPLHIKDLETDLPDSSHQIGDLSTKILFDSISLSGSNGPIAVQSLATTSGKINTSNGQISGIFNASESLLLATTDSGIRVDVGLTSQGSDSNPMLTARTSNAAIDANINLFSSSGSGGTFTVNAETSNQPLKIAFPNAPSGSTLDLQASTQNGQASVILDAAYAGSFDVQTSAFEDAKVNVVRPNVDGRHVNFSGEGRGETAGTVSWDNQSSSGAGKVVVSTTNGQATLYL
uniref:Uncharacterized protein n=1 Tax=Psilocybe cubensis TaxID=181762 RepID=A0A8H7Y943_PSICU